MKVNLTAARATFRGRPFWFDLIFALLGSFLLLLIVAPLLGLLFATTVSDLSAAAADQEVTRSIRLTLLAALGATLACSISGVPLAYFLARKRFRGKAALLALIDLPIIIPHSAAGIAVLTVLGRHSLIGGIADELGFGFVGTALGISVAMAFVSLPFLVNAAREGFAMVPERLERAARSLGASPWRVFRSISLPMAWRPILSGMIMMWARGISEFGAVIIIAYHPMTTPILVFQRFNDFGLSYARSAAVLLVLICVAIFLVLRLISRKPHREGARDA